MTEDDKALVERWMGQLPRDQFDKLLLLINDTRQAAFNAGLERAAVIAENHMANCLDDKDIQKRWPTIKARNDVYAAAIRAEKEKPQ